MAPVAAEACSDSIKPRDVYIVGVARTPMGGFLGALSSVPATKLGSIAIGAALKRANVDPALVEEVFFGNVLSANLGQAPARQAALGAGLPNSVICTTVNKVCASGLKATMLAAQSIQLGINDVVVAGGMESMSNVPKYFAEARKGSRLGHDSLVDGMLKDGLWDVYNDYGMGVCAELCAEQHSVTREEQDNFAVQSFERGIAAQGCDAFSWEIVPVEVSGGRGRPSTIVDKDEGLGKFDAAKLRKLRPSFKESGGSVTAGNASSISDGAAALVLASGEKVLKLGLQVIAKISGFADAAQAPELFTTAPALAIPKAISNAGLEASQIDFYEINEAFAVVALANQKLLGLNPEKVNVHGGAVALGHPLGCSGARILVTLLGVLKQKNGKYGAAGICNGGGGASALVLELLSEWPRSDLVGTPPPQIPTTRANHSPFFVATLRNLEAEVMGMLKTYNGFLPEGEPSSMGKEKGVPLPKFGEWDVNDPASAEGFTVIFNKARTEKKTGGRPDSPSKEDRTYKHEAVLGKPPSVSWIR
ncbi:hypothetical protein DVH24_028016 [Malus domestica]|uniref:Uncharacterized protein n=2 Tax=Malus TaxID=3749 RepID=A0A498HA34_MALDO|nr:hypothetical protein DVH24_028016 [Malus domestica]